MHCGFIVSLKMCFVCVQRDPICFALSANAMMILAQSNMFTFIILGHNILRVFTLLRQSFYIFFIIYVNIIICPKSPVLKICESGDDELARENVIQKNHKDKEVKRNKKI